MLVKVSISELIKKVREWNRGEGLGMVYLGTVSGPGVEDITTGWQAGNCEIMLSTWDQSTTLVELYLAYEHQPADDLAKRTWDELDQLIGSEYVLDKTDTQTPEPLSSGQYEPEARGDKTAVAGVTPRPVRKYLKDLTSIVYEHYSKDELRYELCPELDFEYEDLPAHGRKAQAGELVKIYYRRTDLDTLKDAIAKTRPNVSLPILS